MFDEHIFHDRYGVAIYTYRSPVKNPKGLVKIVHGLGEHAGRYHWLTEQLNRAGYSVYLLDQRGHGKTGVVQYQGNLSKLGRLGRGGMPAVLENLEQFRDIIRSEEPHLPLFYWGQSWGSLSGQILWNTAAEHYAGLVLTGTAYRMPGWMNSGDLNKRHRHLGTTGQEWLSRDPQVAQDFIEDPLCFNADVLKLFGVVDGLRLFGRPARDLPQKPILIQVGSDDALGGERSVQKLAAAYRDRGGVTDVTVNVYEGGRHEMYNEINKDDVFADLRAWLDTHIETGRAVS